MAINYIRDSSNCPGPCHSSPILIIEDVSRPPSAAATRYESKVQLLLDWVLGTRSGECVWCEICWRHTHTHMRRIRISPCDMTNYGRASPSAGSWFRSRSSPRSETTGTLGPLQRAPDITQMILEPPDTRELHGGVVYISPSEYRPAQSPDGRPQIPSQEDNVILHEITHALMRMSGYVEEVSPEPLAFNDDRSYRRIDEFWAILVENYFRAERHQPLRRDHDGYARMEEDEQDRPQEWLYNSATAQSGLPQDEVTNLDLVNLFTRMQPRLARCLSNIEGLEFNPIQQLYT